MRCSLSPGERVRVRGNETPPTKTAGRTSPAQLDRLTEPVAGATQKQISRRALRTTGVSRQSHWCFERCFPLTPALSLGERENRPPHLRQSTAPRPVAARDAVFPLPAGGTSILRLSWVGRRCLSGGFGLLCFPPP